MSCSAKHPPGKGRRPRRASRFAQAGLALAVLAPVSASSAQDASYDVTIVRGGSGRGIVSFTQPTVACTEPRCTRSVAAGTRVTITAAPLLGGAFSGWVDTPGCSGIGPCVIDVAADVTVTAQFTGGPNYAFLSARTVSANLGGLARADAVCEDEARAAGLPGSYVAWLSDSTVAAPTRLVGSRGWVRPDGRPFADRSEDIAASRVYYPLRVDAHGYDLGADAAATTVFEAWTGTFRGGARASGRTCGDWTQASAGASATAGSGMATGVWFSDAYSVSCAAQARLYCFGVGAVAEVVPRIERGRVAFVTRYEFRPTGGLEAADRTCADDARAAGLAGRFRALLATTAASAASRFDPSGPAWVSVDGLPLTAHGDSLRARVPFLMPARDQYGASPAAAVWTGARTLLDPGTRADTCDDWRGGSGLSGRAGSSILSTAPYYLQDLAVPCDGSGLHPGVLCLQE